MSICIIIRIFVIYKNKCIERSIIRFLNIVNIIESYFITFHVKMHQPIKVLNGSISIRFDFCHTSIRHSLKYIRKNTIPCQFTIWSKFSKEISHINKCATACSPTKRKYNMHLNLIGQQLILFIIRNISTCNVRQY